MSLTIVNDLPHTQDCSEEHEPDRIFLFTKEDHVAKDDASVAQIVFIQSLPCQVGIAACQLARNLGCRVIGTAGTEAGLEAARQSGAHLTVNHRDKGYLDQIQVFTACGVKCIGRL